MHRNKKTSVLGIIITIIVLILLVLLTNVKIQSFANLENAFSKIVMPIQNAVTYAKNKIRGNNTLFSDIDNLKSENEQLKQENSELEQQLRELEIVKAENKTLQEYLGIAQKYTQYKIPLPDSPCQTWRNLSQLHSRSVRFSYPPAAVENHCV